MCLLHFSLFPSLVFAVCADLDLVSELICLSMSAVGFRGNLLPLTLSQQHCPIFGNVTRTRMHWSTCMVWACSSDYSRGTMLALAVQGRDSRSMGLSFPFQKMKVEFSPCPSLSALVSQQQCALTNPRLYCYCDGWEVGEVTHSPRKTLLSFRAWNISQK